MSKSFGFLFGFLTARLLLPLLPLLLLLLLHLPSLASAFVAPPSSIVTVPKHFMEHRPIPSTATNTKLTKLHAKKTNQSNQSNQSKTTTEPIELFELQELRAQLKTMLDKNILHQSLSMEKKRELSEYVRAVVEKVPSPVDVSGGNGMGVAKFVAGIENKSWRMVFVTDGGDGSASQSGSGSGSGGTDSESQSDMPYGSTVLLRIGDIGSFSSGIGGEGGNAVQGTLDYVLKFNKQVWGLKELVAKSSCSVDMGPLSPGLLTIQYENIQTNVFGLSNLPVGFFGLLKGRVQYMETVWFDGERWVERNYAEDGSVVYSVFVRDMADEKR